MSTGVIIAIIIGVVILLIIAFIWGSYNSLVRLNERVNEAWSDITVQLKYRADLIPNLVETVKGYAKHEKSAFEDVTKARAAVMSAKSVDGVAQAEKSLEGALSKVFAIAEAYPELKANENFKELQVQLQDTEDKIQAARRFYNNGAKELNTKIKMFPINLFHGFGFKTREYYNVDEATAKQIEDAPKVEF
ncbi:LemA family protein [Candidatus Saccharibacteria bacterium]|nr:LemA family protein [Candidatus Saccharibacteria bacterium]